MRNHKIARLDDLSASMNSLYYGTMYLIAYLIHSKLIIAISIIMIISGIYRLFMYKYGSEDERTTAE
jgi:hypothetical protein